jgi:hypothetical protein
MAPKNFMYICGLKQRSIDVKLKGYFRNEEYGQPSP